MKTEKEKEKEFINRVVKQGDAEELFKLGYSYEFWKDYKKAAELYQSLAKQSNLKALYRLAHLYAWGSGDFPQDIQKAVELCHRAAEQGHEPSLFALKFLHEKGSLGFPDGPNTNNVWRAYNLFFRLPAPEKEQWAAKVLLWKHHTVVEPIATAATATRVDTQFSSPPRP